MEEAVIENRIYKKINERINSLNSWDQTIARINELDDLILKALKEKDKARLEELVYERINIGRRVIEFKRKKGMKIERKEREEEIIKYVKDYASKNRMDQDAVEDVFRMLIEKNKHIQSLQDKRLK